jgi:AraC-like DNA-binding protein
MGGCRKVVVCVLLFCCCFSVDGQNKTVALKSQSFLELFAEFNYEENVLQKIKISEAVISKSKIENNHEYLVAGYHMMASLYDNDKLLSYSDSLIELTKGRSDRNYPLLAYEMKADYYFLKKNYTQALDNYLEYSFWAEKYQDKNLILRARYYVGTLRRRIGEPRKALLLFKESYDHGNESTTLKDTAAYIGSITSIANIYNDMEMGDSSSFYNKIGYRKALDFGYETAAQHFALNEGVSLYYLGRYKEAIDSLEKYIPFYEATDSKVNLSLAYYYNGKSYDGLNEKGKSLIFYKKVDTIFQLKNSIYPNARDAYLKLISYYKNQKDLSKQLHYVNQLIKVDSVFHAEQLYLNSGIYKKYDLPRLKSEKNFLITKMNKKELISNSIIAVIIIVLISSLGLLYYQFKRKILYKKRFEQIISNDKKVSIANSTAAIKNELKESNHIKASKIESEKKVLDISSEIITEIMKKLENFESSHEYTNNNITLNLLASKFDTNNNYLSKIINHFKDQSFSNYINNLRIEYFIEQAKANPTLRKFTIKAIATEVGFNNSESFSKAFYKQKGIKPSYFLKKLATRDKKASLDS